MIDNVEVPITISSEVVPTRAKDDKYASVREVPGALTDPALKRVNDWLTILGTHEDGRSHWRMTLTNQTEKRFGEFATFYGDILIKVEKEVVEVPKYSWVHDPRWVLEKLYFIPITAKNQMREEDTEVEGLDQGVYEPYYVFDLIQGKPVLPPIKAIQMLLKLALLGPKRTAADWDAMDEEEQKQEVELVKELLHDDRPIEALQRLAGERISNAGTESQI